MNCRVSAERVQQAPIYLRYIRIPFQINCRASTERVQPGPIYWQYISTANPPSSTLLVDLELWKGCDEVVQTSLCCLKFSDLDWAEWAGVTYLIWVRCVSCVWYRSGLQWLLWRCIKQLSEKSSSGDHAKCSCQSRNASSSTFSRDSRPLSPTAEMNASAVA